MPREAGSRLPVDSRDPRLAEGFVGRVLHPAGRLTDGFRAVLSYRTQSSKLLLVPKHPSRPSHGAVAGRQHEMPSASRRAPVPRQSNQPHRGAAEPKQEIRPGDDRCSKLLADPGGGIMPGMERDRTEQATPDLFSTAASFGQSSPPPRAKQSSPQKRRHVLPNDLPNAVRHLDDRELDLLITASLEEAKRRGRSLPNVQSNTPDQSHGSGRRKWPHSPKGGKWKWCRSR
jgi:hypothetical protein